VEEPDGSIAIELGPDWPFGGYAVQRFELDAAALTCTVEVHATDRSMPAQAGWHPWFQRPVEVRFAARSMYALDGDGIPTGELVDPSDPPWDDCFTGMTEPPRLQWPGGPSLQVTSTCSHWVVFNQLDHGVCVEPQTGPPDGFTIAPLVVEPGNPLVASARFSWAAPLDDT
jgi:aldose 1-epimerase